MNPPESRESEKRREGRRMACEALLASRFGQRSTTSGARALARLRAGDGRESVILRPARFVRPWLALAAAVAVLLAGGWMVLQRVGRTGMVLLAQAPEGVVVERNGKGVAPAADFGLCSGDVVRTRPGATTQVRLPRDAGVLTLRPNTVLEVRLQGRDCRLMLSSGTMEGDLSAKAADCLIMTPHAQLQRPAGQFVVAARMTSTWVGVDAGSVDIATSNQGVPLHLGSEEYAVAVPGLRLEAQSLSHPWRTPYAGTLVAAVHPPM